MFNFTSDDGRIKLLSGKEIIVLGGGTDISPMLYKQAPLSTTQKADIKRDYHCLDLVNTAMSENIPVFGVCRGLQFLTAYHGGSLYQEVGHISGEVHLTDMHGFSHPVAVCHHQAVNELDREAKVLAVYKHKNLGELPYIVYWPRYNHFAVQFHPEWMDSDSIHFLDQMMAGLIGFTFTNLCSGKAL